MIPIASKSISTSNTGVLGQLAFDRKPMLLQNWQVHEIVQKLYNDQVS